MKRGVVPGEPPPGWVCPFYVVFSVALAILCVTSVAVLSVQHVRSSSPNSFGHAFKAAYFLIEHGMLELNHGSFGATPRPVLDAASRYAQEMERGTGRWFHGGVAEESLRRARSAVSSYVGAQNSTLVFVTNASSGINAVLRSLSLSPSDAILLLQWEYPMGRFTSRYVAHAAGATVLEVPMEYPTDEDRIVAAVEAALDAPGGERVRFALLDHIVSAPGFIMPIERLLAVCRARNITTLVDGAHAIGQIALNLTALDADYYVTNGHKWLCSPKGGAVLVVAPRCQLPSLHPATISNYFGQGYQTEFYWTGTRDFSAWLAMEDAIAFRMQHGGDAVWRAYNNELCARVFDTLSARWGVERTVPPSMTASLLTMRLPCANGRCDGLSLDALQAFLRTERNIWSVVFVYDGVFYVRFSCQVYNELSDYIAFADAFDAFLGK
jgi:isopenicillin-N epimerase